MIMARKTVYRGKSQAKKGADPLAPEGRSKYWFGQKGMDGFHHRSWMKNQGLPHHLFDGRPVIGICNTWSELTPCNAHFRVLAERVKRGIYEAGGFPVEFPVSSLGETLMRPTTMMFRNLASMDVEEAIRAHPMDGVVLMVGCDKTTPALLMGAASCDLPTIALSGGPMLNGRYGNETIGSGTHVWKFVERQKAGTMTFDQMTEAEACMSRSVGHCMTMGTASTMASMVESLGMGLPTNAAIPAADSRRNVLAHMVGRRIVEMVKEDLRMSKILTKKAFENAIRVNGAIGGSTNAVVHLLAIAGRMGVKITLDDWDRLGRDVPCLVNLMPSGQYLMEDFYYAGGLPVVMKELAEAGLLHKTAKTVNGKSQWANVKGGQLQRGRDPSAEETVQGQWRHCRAARQSCSVRCCAQTLCRHAEADEAQGQGGGVRGYRRLQGARRRPEAGHRRDQHHGAQELRTEGLSGLSRGGQHGAAGQALEEGCDRCCAHFRCAHVGHGLWHGGAARGTRGGCRWAAGAGAQWRHDRTGREGAFAASGCFR
jgi:dihydroxyacid dehydratase/phosphogluconate dehydratase